MYFQVLLLNRSCNFEYFKTFILCRGFHFSKKKATIHTTSLENTWIVLWLLMSLLIYSHISELLKAGYCSSQHPFRTLAQLKILLQSHPCWRIFSIVEPTIWHLGDSPKYEWPIHRAQWSCLAKAPSSPPSSIRKTIFSAAVLALFPEINKRGTWSCPWNPQSIKPLWGASTWHKQSDLSTMGKSYSALWDLGDTIALRFQSTH